MNNIGTRITPAMAMYLRGLLYRNTRTSCVSLALLCAHVSHDTLRRVLYQKVPWSRRLWESLAQGLVAMGGYLVIDDTSWERFTRVADAVSWVWSSSVGKPVWGMQVVLLLWTSGKWTNRIMSVVGMGEAETSENANAGRPSALRNTAIVGSPNLC